MLTCLRTAIVLALTLGGMVTNLPNLHAANYTITVYDKSTGNLVTDSVSVQVQLSNGTYATLTSNASGTTIGGSNQVASSSSGTLSFSSTISSWPVPANKAITLVFKRGTTGALSIPYQYGAAVNSQIMSIAMPAS